jgi:hypothetical protein
MTIATPAPGAVAPSYLSADAIFADAKAVLDFIGTVSPVIPWYGQLIGTVAKIGSAVIAEEPTAVALYQEITGSVGAGETPTVEALNRWAAEADAANDRLAAHIQDRLKAVPPST